MIVWCLTGFWHGANWNFLLWGLYFGVLLLVEKLLLLKHLQTLPKVLQHIYALFFIVIGWGIFAFEDTAQLKSNFANMFGLGHLPIWNEQTSLWFTQFLPLMIVLIVGSTPLMDTLHQKFNEKFPNAYQLYIEPVCTAAMLILSTAYLASSAFNPFLYFRF